ncbi:CheA signal transduction histidine kinase [Collimonas sp. OK242]|jgi:two-component system chemotaxis sensor kinase CheA|uniref:chemotaxis protein CheA n=1 Tax=Collimonas sp. OK242 TaxID=1798195 RepID=UPI0008994C16|nr:chemotaxis protein CheA [Collimonas sp. OK242]SDX46110.1 CheA signal transduction histidine kinase [Collimonas sp. OK242]
MDITEFYQTFFEEADELLAEMEQLLLGLDMDAPDSEHLNAIFRAAHSIKGGAATFGFVALTDTTHLLENLLDRARHQEIRLRKEMIDAFLETKDVLQEQISAYRAGTEPDPEMVARICAVLQQLAHEESAGAASPALAAPAPIASAAPVAGPSSAVVADSSQLRVKFSRISESDRKLLSSELENLGEVVAQTQSEDSLTLWLETSCKADDIIAVCCFIIDIDQIDIAQEAVASADSAAAAQPLAEAPSIAVAEPVAAKVIAIATAAAPTQPKAAAIAANPAAPAAAKESSSIRVDVEKVDQIINLVGELVITQSMLAQTAATLDPVLHERLLNGMGQLERNARDLQESVMSIRMMQMDYVFSRFPRLVRDLTDKLGKQVQLVTFGKATELDKSLIERIIDPLTHLVRNSLDHGIEKPEQRIAAGKDPAGQLLLSAQHQGGNIVIEVSDDGAGLNREKILAKAIQQGMAISETISDDEVWQLIFAPGFSTAEKITDVSGRGVGMDVVKRNIQEMGGHVEISSRQGNGTTTKIVLPLTLAILDGMSVKVGNEVYILPLNFVIESLQPRAEDIHSVSNEEQVLHVRGEYLPLTELHRVFNVADARTDPTQGIVVILHGEGKRFALLVDQLVGQHQVVVKNLETNYRKVPGISAATILGDGSVALIVDVSALQRANREKTPLLAAA